MIVDSQGIAWSWCNRRRSSALSIPLLPRQNELYSLYAAFAGVICAMGHAPIRVITVEREYGSRGGEFAHDLAERLGWRLLDAELINRAAKAAGVDPRTCPNFDERLDPWYYRYGKLFWHDHPSPAYGMGEEHVFDSETHAEIIKQQIQTAAKQGNCVLVGRGAACALAVPSRLLPRLCLRHVEGQARVVCTSVSKQAQNAEQHLAAFDKRRAAVIRKFYQQEWCSRGLYHMLLNSAMGTEAMIARGERSSGTGNRKPVARPVQSGLPEPPANWHIKFRPGELGRQCA